MPIEQIASIYVSPFCEAPNRKIEAIRMDEARSDCASGEIVVHPVIYERKPHMPTHRIAGKTTASFKVGLGLQKPGPGF